MASSTPTGAVYGTGVYGTDIYGLSGVEITVYGSQAVATADPDVIITADAVHSITSVQGVGATGGVGDITGDSSLDLPSVEATASPGTVRATSINIIPVSGLSATGSVTTATVVAEAVVDLPSVESTGQVDDGFNFQSIYFPTGVEGTGEVTTAVVGNNAIPTFTGVSATCTPRMVTATTTTVIFDVANKDHERTAYVSSDEPRIVYVKAA